jgi:alanyl-tRNA synthetase
MDSQLLYQDDVTILEFDASVVEVFHLPKNQSGVVLDRTYFYPTSGGQEHDTGQLGSAKVVDVFKDDRKSRLVHVVQGEISIGQVHAVIDPERRFRHMQNHTAQHLLTQCILRQTGFETVSANINGYSPSTLDIIATQITKSDLDQAEGMANQVIYENRPVKTYFVTPEELQSIPLRRPPKVTENIRIVEIDNFDFSPCGGTHVLQTGAIGLVKILKVERQNEKQRIHFAAGWQALGLFEQMYESIMGIAAELSISWQDIPELVGKQSEQLSAIQKELQRLRQSGIKNEARELVDAAETTSGIKLVKASFSNRPSAELRMLADELSKVHKVVAYLASFDGQKVSLIVTCAEGSGKDARQLLSTQLEYIKGRGGGDIHIAQGGGVISPEQSANFLQTVNLG